MIAVTRLSGGPLVVNVDLILTIEQTPDTVIGFANGEKLLVRETPDEVVSRVLAYRRRTGAGGASSVRGDGDGE